MSNKATQLSTRNMRPEAPRRRTAYLKKIYLSSDEHSFVGRIYDLSIVAYHFETHEEMSQHPDCVYALNVNSVLSVMTRRVESLNHVADTLWVDDHFVTDANLPVTRYEWLNICADTFLMRFVSLLDCALLLVNEVFECELRPQICSLKKLRKCGVTSQTLETLKEIEHVIGELRIERNERFHRGWEREHTTDDVSFKMSTAHEHRGMQMTGHDQFGHPISQEKFFREGLVNLQRDYKKFGPLFVRKLDNLYEALAEEFEMRFSPKFNDPKTGFGVKMRPTNQSGDLAQ